jgi:hypothetical protein
MTGLPRYVIGSIGRYYAHRRSCRHKSPQAPGGDHAAARYHHALAAQVETYEGCHAVPAR